MAEQLLFMAQLGLALLGTLVIGVVVWACWRRL